jgi:hypothetical protein
MGDAAGLISSWSGHLYALATPDGRVKTYDTGKHRVGPGWAAAAPADRFPDRAPPPRAVTGRLRGSLSQAGAPGSIQAAALPNGNLADGVQSLAWLDGSEVGSRAPEQAHRSRLRRSRPRAPLGPPASRPPPLGGRRAAAAAAVTAAAGGRRARACAALLPLAGQGAQRQPDLDQRPRGRPGVGARAGV